MTPASTLIGATLDGAYRIDALIAEGGMSAVYEGVQLRLNQRVAVKVMARELASNREALGRFRREAEIASHLRHPHLVTVMDFGTAPEGQPYLVMEYLDGIDLDRRIRESGPLPLATAVHITKQVASALGGAHDQGIVHRDLKPANVFLIKLAGEPDFAKILDFGISKVRAASTQLTKASAIIGTPNYMSPEQSTGMIDEIDHRTDQWALACIVWEMLSGRPPFASDDMSAVFYQIIHLDPQPLGKRVRDLPPAVEVVLRRALSKSAADRFSSIRDFASALETAAAPPVAAAALPGPMSAQSSSEQRASDGVAGIDRRRSGQERRQSPRPLPGDQELQSALRLSPWQRVKPIHVTAALVLALATGFVVTQQWKTSRRAASPTVPIAPAADTPAATAVPAAPAAPAAQPSAPLVAAPAVVEPMPKKATPEEPSVRRRPMNSRSAPIPRGPRKAKPADDFVDPFGP